jgi:ABC-2 type transport system permease protein
MKQFLSFVKKEFHHIARYKRTLFILLGMPIMQIVIFGFALTNEVKNSKIAILDNSKDLATMAIRDEIGASRYFNIVEDLHSYNDIEKAFRNGSIKLALVFPAHFNDDLAHLNTAQVQLVADASDPNVANTLTNYASAIILDYQDRIKNNAKLPYTINTEERMLYNPQLKGA